VLNGKGLWLLLGIMLLCRALASARRLAILCNPCQVGGYVSYLGIGGAGLAIGSGLLPMSTAVSMFGIVSLFGCAVAYRWRPLRMDYNLFLRGAQNMLEGDVEEVLSPEATPRLNKSQLLAFARFLGSRWLAVDYHWEGDGLKLLLPAVKLALCNRPSSIYSSFGRQSYFFLRGQGSSVTLQWNGSVSAQLANEDERALLVLEGSAAHASTDLQKQVAASVECAWRHFRKGDAALAEHAIGG
jgi:hypothetical protein